MREDRKDLSQLAVLMWIKKKPRINHDLGFFFSINAQEKSTFIKWHIFLIIDLANYDVMPSSVVAAIRYNDSTSTLRVVYVSGSVYDYKQVPLKVYEEMRTASSKGEFLNKHIKPQYKFEKIK